MSKKAWIGVALILPCLAFAEDTHRSRHVALVGDSLFGCAQDAIVNAINDKRGDNLVSAQYIQGGTTAFSNPINKVIQSEGIAAAFGKPDVVAFSFATNDMMTVAQEKISMHAAIAAMQTLMDQAVEAGATCIVMLESSHRFRGDFPLAASFATHMDRWFEYWQSKTGENHYEGKPYQFFIADISDAIEADMNTYFSDMIHFNEAGAGLAARSILEQINRCPAGKRVSGKAPVGSGSDCGPDAGSEAQPGH